MWLAIALGAILGAALGSFAGVVADRGWREALDPRAPRSRCDACRRRLAWWENAPIVAWLALRGRCRTCRASIPRRLLAYETAGAGIGAAAVVAVLAWASAA